MKTLIYVSCTSAQKYPERPRYLMIRGKKYNVVNVEKAAKIQSISSPSEMIYYYRVKLETGSVVEIEYHENKSEWYLLDSEKYIFF